MKPKVRKKIRRSTTGYSAKLTTKYQATIPKKVRDQLQLQSGDQVIYEVLEDGTVVLRKSSPLDLEYLRTLNTTMNEWKSDEDEKAYKDL